MTKPGKNRLDQLDSCSRFSITNLSISITVLLALFVVGVHAQESAVMHKLTIVKAGNGSGTVASAPAGIVCEPTCSASFPQGTVISLSAAPMSGSSLAGWTGCDAVSGNSCNVAMGSGRNVTAIFVTTRPTLLLNKMGNGVGQVLSAPAGISCDPVCIASFTQDTVLTLTALPAPGSLFGEWSGCDTATGNICKVSLSANKTVSARFDSKSMASYTLTINKAGSGLGTVTSSPAGFDCALDCPSLSRTVVAGTNLMLVAMPLTSVPTSVSTFGGWSGCDATFGNSCIIIMESNRNISIAFNSVKPTLAVNKTGSGSGKITSTPLGIQCGTACVSEFPSNTSITLEAIPTAGSVFSGWSGCDATTENRCTLTLRMNQTVTATFSAITQNLLTVKKIGTGLGKITSNEKDPFPQGINCGAICQAVYSQGTTLSLIATPAEGSSLAGWTGCDSVSGRVCTVALHVNRTVTVQFAAPTLATLNVLIQGTGRGKVQGPSILCDPTCVSSFNKGTVVNLTAIPLEGSSLSSWKGCDMTSGKTCSVTLNSDRIVSVIFDSSQVYLTVKIIGTGSGKVLGGGINCAPLCSALYTRNTLITLNANALNGSTLESWSGCDATSGKTCSVTLNANRTVTATFSTNTFYLSVLLKGSGNGKVTGKGIVCDPICAALYAKGTLLILSATPTPNSTLVSWSGCDTLMAETCHIALNANKTVTVTFNKKT